MVSPPFTPDDLEKLPDHTDQLESLNSRSKVDGILPRHLGNAERGRFVTCFTVISGRTIQLYCLIDSADGFSFENVHSFKAKQEIEVWESLWEGKIAFHHQDIEDAQDLNRYEHAYASRFSRGMRFPDFEKIKDWADEHLTPSPPEIPDCNHRDGKSEDVPKLPLEVIVCNNCGTPLTAKCQGSTIGSWETFLVEPWWEYSESNIIGGGKDLYFISKDNSSAKTYTDIAIHLLSREAQAEYEVFDHYVGDYSTVGIVYKNNIVGYLTWNTISGRTVLQSIYIRPDSRKQNLAARTLETWFDDICPSETYYASSPNKGGLTALESIGHVGEFDCAIPVRVHSASDAMAEEDVAPGQYS